MSPTPRSNMLTGSETVKATACSSLIALDDPTQKNEIKIKAIVEIIKERSPFFITHPQRKKQ